MYAPREFFGINLRPNGMRRGDIESFRLPSFSSHRSVDMREPSPAPIRLDILIYLRYRDNSNGNNENLCMHLQ